MKRRFLFLFSLLAFLFIACSNVAQGADGSSASSQVAESAIMEARNAVSVAETAINTESPDITALKQAVIALNVATEKLSVALGTSSPDVAALHKEIENVKNAVDEVEKKISELESQNTEEPKEEPKDSPIDAKNDDEPKTNPPQEKKETEQQDDPNPQQQSEATDYSTGKHTLFAKGISKDDTRYDVNKTWVNDTQLCWAATSSNLIAWWQDLYEANEKQLPDLVTKRSAQDLFGLFKAYNSDGVANKPSTFLDGVPWYFVGNQSGKGGADGGYLLSLGWNYMSWNIMAPQAYKYCSNLTTATFSNAVIKGLSTGAAAGLKMLYGTSGGHAITLWGAEVEDGRVTHVYVTDSDDRESGMQKHAVHYEGNSASLKYSMGGRIADLMFLYPPGASK